MNKGYTGVYVAKIGPDGSQEYTYTPYFKFYGMYDHFSEKKRERIVDRAEKQFNKRDKWITSRRMQFYLPHLSDEKIFVTGFSTIVSENNVYLFEIDYDGKPLLRLNAPFHKARNYFQLYTKFQNGFWAGKSWTHDKKFYFTSIFRGVMNQYVVYSDSSTSNFKRLVDFDPFRLFQNVERYMHYWYDNKIVTGRMESDGMNGLQSTRTFILTSWSICEN